MTRKESRIANIARDMDVSLEEAALIYSQEMRRIASKGGKNVPPEKRAFSRSKRLAKRANKLRQAK